MFDWLKSDSPRNPSGWRHPPADPVHGFGTMSRAAGDDPFKLLATDPQPGAAWVSLDRVIHTALRSRAPWLAQRGVAVHFSPGKACVKADVSAVRQIVDELIQWSGARAPEIAIHAGGTGPGSPNLRVRASFASLESGRAGAADRGHEGLLRQLQQLRQRHLRAFFASQPGALCFGVEFAGGTGCGAVLMSHHDRQAIDPASSALAGRRLALLTADDGLRRSVRNLTRGLGLSVRPFASVAQARQDAVKHRPHAVIYDGSLDATAVLSLRQDMQEMTGDITPQFVAVHEGAGDFHLTQSAGLNTVHVGLAALEEALIPALVFTLC
jgi:hypothetical protein